MPNNRLFLSALCLCFSTLVALPAVSFAQDVPKHAPEHSQTFDVEPQPAPEWTFGKVLAMSSAGLVGGVAGTIVGAGAFNALNTPNPDALIDVGSGIFAFTMFAGGSLGGIATGTFLVGESYGFDGSWWSTLGGTAIGTVGSLAGVLWLANNGNATELNLLGAILIPPLAGATLGYALSVEESGSVGSARTPSTSLLHVDSEGSLSWSPPLIAPGFGERGDVRVSVSLLDGRF